MALKECVECKASISSYAKVCPKCGVKRPFDLAIQRTLNKASKTFLQLGLLVMLLTWLFIGC